MFIREFLARFRPVPALSVALAFAALAAMYPDAGEAAERYYRNSLSLITGSPGKYVIEVPEAAAMQGGYFKVTEDGGRVTRVIFLQDGKAVSETVYIYGEGKLPSGSQSFTQGALTGTSKITRDASGRPTRSDSLTAQGALTGYTVSKYTGDRREWANYTPEGKRRSYGTVYYNSDGIQIRSISYTEGSSSHQETTSDPLRGITKSSKQFTNGKLTVSRVNTYDPNDDLIRQDLYNDKDQWYGALTYEHNLLVKRSYKFLDGHTEEVVIKYDAKRWTESAQMSRDGRLICKFVYEHLPDGTIKRTIALGPDGSLWAEYPDLSVSIVQQDGHPPNSTSGVIHKKGNWW